MMNLGTRGDEGKVATVRGGFTVRRGVQPVCTAMPLDTADEQGNMLVLECVLEFAGFVIQRRFVFDS